MKINDQKKDVKNPIEANPERVAPELETDAFGEEEQAKIVRMVKQDIESNIQSMTEWIEQRKRDIQMYEGERPSVIENLDKKEWMSDRNLGICAANCDAYQATLLATCYNIDTVHFKPTEENDIDHKEQIEKFTKWGLGKKEADFLPEVDDFIHNKVTQGISYFYIYWDVWYDWIDRRIPKYNATGDFIGYDIVTEEKRFERGVIENIDDVSDLMFPATGDSLQKKAHLIHRIHRNAKDIIDLGKRGIFVNISEEYVQTLTKHVYDTRVSALRDEKATQLGIKTEKDLGEDDLRMFPIDLYMWYGKYEKNGKNEEYRFIIEPETGKFLAGKPLRKITRSGKRPYVGRPFIRRPGFVRGNSLPHLIEDPVNAINSVFNQKSDFQYVENCPFGWFQPEEGFKEQERFIEPGKMIPTTDPNSVNIPNINRSFAWAKEDWNMLMEVIERLTGAASYFMSNSKGVSGTATRDAIINEKSDTRFGLWVNRIIDDICEAITMWVEMYQDWAPPDLGERVLGEDGKRLFNNFSIETIRGGHDAQITPDVISGSKALQKEIMMWALTTLNQTVWFNPQINPRGNWHLTVETAKAVGYPNVEKYMPPEPKPMFKDTKLVKDKWTQIRQGEIPTIDPTDDIMELYMGMMELNETKREDLDPEYIPNLDVFLFKLQIAMQNQVKQTAMQQQSNMIASSLISDIEAGRIKQEDAVNA